MHPSILSFYKDWVKTVEESPQQTQNRLKAVLVFFIILFSQLETLVGKIRSEQGDCQIRPDGRLYAENYYALLEDKHSQVQNEKKEKN